MMTKRQLAYLCLALFLGFLLNIGGTLGYVRYVEHQRMQAERAAQAEQARQADQTRRIICDLANGYLRTYADNPPVTPAGVGVQQTWQAMAARFLCPPPG
jgi:hypothetical protein